MDKRMNDFENWNENNKKYLAMKIKEIQQKLRTYLESGRKNVHDDGIADDTKNKTTETSFIDVFLADENKTKVKKNVLKNISKDFISNTARRNNFVPAIEILSKAFKLSEFEKDMLLLCAAVELDSETSRLCSKIHHDSVGNNMDGIIHPTFALGFAIFFRTNHWSALLPTSPLRRYQLLKFVNSHHQLSGPLVYLPVMISEQIIHYLLGLAYSETEISGIIKTTPKLVDLEAGKITSNNSLHYYNDNIVRLLELCKANVNKVSIDTDDSKNHNAEQYSIPVIILSGGDEITELLLAQQVCAKLGLQLKYLEAENIPSRHEDLLQLAQSWTRDAMLLSLGLFISHKSSSEDTRNQILQSLKIFVENIPAPVFVHTSQVLDLSRSYNVINIKKPSKTEQIHLWTMFLESTFKRCKIDNTAEKDQIVKKLINQFDFTSSEIFQVCKDGINGNSINANKESLYELLWEKSLDAAKPKVGNLGILIPSSATSYSDFTATHSSIANNFNRLSLDDIVLPPREKETLKTILIHCQHRDKVYREWGFQEKNRSRGLAITVLFVGPSGTGKTMASEILASALNLNLLRVDLSQIVSKYIGETEKNLDKIFESAKRGGYALHCDEADALFGKRTEITHALDRYSNMETSYLLQRMESFNGLVVLSTNMFKALDSAFMRRISFKVNFDLPDEERRFEIWKKTFPKETPLASIDFASLSKLKITGGNIRNICLNASFFAAHDDMAVNKTHINKALQIEYSKMGRSLSDDDLLA
jgi:AAA+ superfamily predicted ATPase